MDEKEALLNGIRDNATYAQAIEMVRSIAFGEAWLVGDTLYRTIIDQARGTSTTNAHLDFLVSKGYRDTRVPAPWSIKAQGFSGMQITNGQFTVSVKPAGNVAEIVRSGLEGTVENYLRTRPLTIDSIAYDLGSGELLGEAGLEALRSRTVAVNCYKSAAHVARQNRLKGVDELVKQKAYSLGFTPIT